MDLEMKARVYALELLTTPNSAQTKWAKEHLHKFADRLPLETESLDEEARLRVNIKAVVGGILETALARAKAIPLRPPSYGTGTAGWSLAGCAVTTCSLGTPSQEAPDQAASPLRSRPNSLSSTLPSAMPPLGRLEIREALTPDRASDSPELVRAAGRCVTASGLSVVFAPSAATVVLVIPS